MAPKAEILENRINISNVDAVILELREKEYLVKPLANDPKTYLVLLKTSTDPLRLKPVGSIYREKGEIVSDSKDPDCFSVLEKAKRYAK